VGFWAAREERGAAECLTSAHPTGRKCLYIRFTRLVLFRASAAGPLRAGKNGPMRKRQHERPKTTSKSEVNIALVPASDFCWSSRPRPRKIFHFEVYPGSNYFNSRDRAAFVAVSCSSPRLLALLVSSDQRPTPILLWPTSRNPVGQNKHSVGCKREEPTVHLLVVRRHNVSWAAFPYSSSSS
jgi:hypothetical protein